MGWLFACRRLWFVRAKPILRPRPLRGKFREQSENYSLIAKFKACGVSTIKRDLIGQLLEVAGSDHSQRSAQLPPELRIGLESYLQTGDVVKLMSLTQRYSNWRFDLLVDGYSEQAYLLLSQSPDQVPTVMNLTGNVSDQTIQMKEVTVEAIDKFIRSKSLWLTPDLHSTVNQSADESPELAFQMEVSQ